MNNQKSGEKKKEQNNLTRKIFREKENCKYLRILKAVIMIKVEIKNSEYFCITERHENTVNQKFIKINEHVNSLPCKTTI